MSCFHALPHQGWPADSACGRVAEPLRRALLLAAVGSDATLHAGCKRMVCEAANATGLHKCWASFSPANDCPSPLRRNVSLVLAAASWSTLLAGRRNVFIAVIEEDATAALGAAARVTHLELLAPASAAPQRQQIATELHVVLSVPASTSPAMEAAMTTNSTWLVRTTGTYQALGGAGSLGVRAVAATTPQPPPPTTLAPTNATPPPTTTAAPATSLPPTERVAVGGSSTSCGTACIGIIVACAAVVLLLLVGAVVAARRSNAADDALDDACADVQRIAVSSGKASARYAPTEDAVHSSFEVASVES